MLLTLLFSTWNFNFNSSLLYPVSQRVLKSGPKQVIKGMLLQLSLLPPQLSREATRNILGSLWNLLLLSQGTDYIVSDFYFDFEKYWSCRDTELNVESEHELHHEPSIFAAKISKEDQGLFAGLSAGTPILRLLFFNF